MAAHPAMTERDQILRKQFLAILTEQGRELSGAELAILDAFLASSEHFTRASLYRHAREVDAAVTEPITAEVLQMLCEYKVAHEGVIAGQPVYEHYHIDSHHDHFVCVKCGGIERFFDPTIEKLQTENARRANFRPIIHRLEIVGVCAECVARESRTRTLWECLEGETVEVTRVVTDDETRHRLGEMGIAAGAEIHVLGKQSNLHTAMVVVKGTRLALSAEICMKVKVVSPEPDRTDAPFPARRKGRRRFRGEAENEGRRTCIMEDEKRLVPMCEMGPGQRGRISKIRPTCPFKKRLLEMGFVSGAEVEKVKVAPLADPAEYILKGYHVSLRSEEACDILVDEVTGE